jgi:hypothetical protein
VPDLARFQTAVDRKLDAGESFSDIEDYIAAAPLSDRCKSALWLYGWAHQDPRTQLRLAKETLALVSHPVPDHAGRGSQVRREAREAPSHRGRGRSD